MIMHEPLHPGIVVKDALIDGTGMSVTEAAERLGVTRTTLSRLLNCHAGISTEMALRLSMLFGSSIDMWVNIQSQYDIWQTKQHANSIHIEPLKRAA
jgi:addiction module HigA family antidote